MFQLWGRSARSVLCTVAMLVSVLSIPSGAARAQCGGDCNEDDEVTIDELVVMVNIALGNADIEDCFDGDANEDDEIAIDDILTAVRHAINGCTEPTPGPTATATTTGGVPPTPTPTGGPASDLTQVRLTYLQVKYDLTKPVTLNNAVPIKFGITSHSADPNNPATKAVIVGFQFIEADPADPANPRSCGSNGVELKLKGDGVEQQFEADIYPTTVCATWAGPNAVANLLVDFDPGLRLAGTPTGIDYPPVTFSTANQNAADNQLCRKTMDPNAANPGRGCVYAIKLEQTPEMDGKPLVDIKLDSLKPESSVAVLWPTAEDPDVPQGSTESDPPSLVVNAVFVMDGRDPYKNQIDPSQLPPDLVAAEPSIAEDLKFGLTDEELGALDDLPGPAMVKYDLVPTSRVAQNEWLPLAIDDPANPDPDGHVEMLEVTELEPGTDNGRAHALYIDGETRTAVSAGGQWADETDFTVRGCLIATFPEGGNQGEEEDPEDMPAGGDVMNGDCKTFKVRLSRAPAVGSGAAAMHSFDLTWTRSIGGERIAVSGNLRTSNTLDLNGARTDTEGTLDLKGNIGANYSVVLFRAFAKGGALTALATSSIDVGVEAFGVSLGGNQMMGSEITYSVPIMFMKEFKFPVLSFGFGPVSIGITAGVGGGVGLTPSLTISAKDGPEASVPALAMATSNGSLQVMFVPSAALTGSVEGGISLLIAKAGLVAQVQVVQIGFPVTATMRWGVTAKDDMNMVKQLTVLGDLNWDLTLNWFNVNLDAVGSVGIGWFSKDLTINIFKYATPEDRVNLLMRKLEPIALGEAGAMPTPTGEMGATPTPTGEIPPTPEPTPSEGGE